MGQVEVISSNASQLCADESFDSSIAWKDLQLSIDRINLTINLPPHVVARIQKFISEISPSSSDTSIPKAPFHRLYGDAQYKTGFKAYLNDILAWEPTGASAFVCKTGAKKPGWPNTRFSWNPAKCHPVDIAGLVFKNYLGLESSFLAEAKVSRIDFAIDVPSVRVDSVAISYPKMTLCETRVSNGKTLYLGGKKGKTRVVAYDKRAEIISSNQKLGTYLAEIHEAVPPHHLMRIEVQLKSPKVLLWQLSDFVNPFEKVRVHAYSSQLTRIERATLVIARHEGLNRAMKVTELSAAERKSLARKCKKAGTPKWWRPHAVWAAQAPASIASLVHPYVNPTPYTASE